MTMETTTWPSKLAAGAMVSILTFFQRNCLEELQQRPSQSMSRGKKTPFGCLPVMGLAPLKTMVPKKHEKIGDLTMKNMI